MDDFEQLQITLKDGMLYRVPPFSTAQGFHCANWAPKDCLFRGGLKIITKGDAMRLEFFDKITGAKFTDVPVEFKDGKPSLERALDSSRFFVLINHPPSPAPPQFVGVGFETRDDAFDFNVTIQDHATYLQRKNQPVRRIQADLGDLRVHEGEKVQIRIGGMNFGNRNSSASSRAATGFAPPPGASKPVTSFAPPPAPVGSFAPPPPSVAPKQAQPVPVASAPQQTSAQPVQPVSNAWNPLDLLTSTSPSSGTTATGTAATGTTTTTDPFNWGDFKPASPGQPAAQGFDWGSF